MRRVLRPLPLMVVMVLLVEGCRCGGNTGTVTGSFRVEPTALDFGRALEGTSPTLAVTVTSEARVAVTVTLEATPPFEVQGPVTLAPGLSEEVPVTFRAGAGPATGTLTVSDGDGVVTVELAGVGVRPPACLPTRACVESRYDLEADRCVETPLPDDSPCTPAGRCLEQGRCLAGSCLGVARTCDDGNACTVDGCAMDTGCVNTPRSCPRPTAPCRVPTCDPSSGCGELAAPDGTPCGPITCATSNLCFAGTCQAFDTPDGTPCGAPLACVPAGTCQNRTCQRPDAGDWQPRWSAPLTPEGLEELSLALTSDAVWLSACGLFPDAGSLDGGGAGPDGGGSDGGAMDGGTADAGAGAHADGGTADGGAGADADGGTADGGAGADADGGTADGGTGAHADGGTADGGTGADGDGGTADGGTGAGGLDGGATPAIGCGLASWTLSGFERFRRPYVPDGPRAARLTSARGVLLAGDALTFHSPFDGAEVDRLDASVPAVRLAGAEDGSVLVWRDDGVLVRWHDAGVEPLAALDGPGLLALDLGGALWGWDPDGGVLYRAASDGDGGLAIRSVRVPADDGGAIPPLLTAAGTMAVVGGRLVADTAGDGGLKVRVLDTGPPARVGLQTSASAITGRWPCDAAPCRVGDGVLVLSSASLGSGARQWTVDATPADASVTLDELFLVDLGGGALLPALTGVAVLAHGELLGQRRAVLQVFLDGQPLLLCPLPPPVTALRASTVEDGLTVVVAELADGGLALQLYDLAGIPQLPVDWPRPDGLQGTRRAR